MKTLSSHISSKKLILFISIILLIETVSYSQVDIDLPGEYLEINSDYGVSVFQHMLYVEHDLFIEIVDMNAGATLQFMAGNESNSYSGDFCVDGETEYLLLDDVFPGAWGDNDPRFERNTIYDYWNEFEESEAKAFSVCNAAFFDCSTYPGGFGCEYLANEAFLSFPLKSNGEIISGGHDPCYNAALSLRALHFNDGDEDAEIIEYGNLEDDFSYLISNPDFNDNFIVGFNGTTEPAPTSRVYIGLRASGTQIVLLFGEFIGHDEAIEILINDFNVPSDQIILLDGGGSQKFVGKGIGGETHTYTLGYSAFPYDLDPFYESRKLPQVIGVVAGDAPIGGGDDSPPVNDDPCNAILLPVYFDCTPTWGDNEDATNSVIPLAYCPDDGFSYGDVWFKLTIPVTGEVFIAMNEGTIEDCAMTVYTGTCTSMTEIACDATNSPLSEFMPFLHLTGLPGAETLWIRVWEFNNNDFGTFQICAYGVEDDGGGGGGGDLDAPDLHVEIISITDDDPNEGQEVTITATVDNECGSETADNSELHFYFSDDCDLDEDDDEYLGYVSTSSLDECYDDEDDFTFDIPSVSYSGTYYIIADADGDDEVVEESEGNNTACLEIEVEDLGEGFADLTAIWYELHPNPASPGTEIYFEYWAQNLGGFEATDPIVRYYLSNDCNYDVADEFLLENELPDLEPFLTDYHESELIIIPEGTPEGTYYILVNLDPDNLIDEGPFENNNIECMPIEISLDAYDFKPSITSINLDTAGYGWDVDFEIFITNSSIVETDLIHTGLFLSTDSIYDALDQYLGQATESDLPGGESWIESPDFDVPIVTYGDYYVIVFVDHDELTLESNEENNFDFVPFTIAPPVGLPDLVAYTDEVIPNIFPADIGGPATFECRSENIGLDLTTECTQRWYLSNDCTYDIGDTYIIGTTVYPMTPGDYTSPSVGWGGAIRPEGTYYLLYIVDFFNVMVEENEYNNIACYPIYYVNPDDCAFSLAPDSITISADSISNGILVSSFEECEWIVSTDAPWITITSPTDGIGTTYIYYHVDENPTPYDRIGHILLNDSVATIYQLGSTGFSDLLINIYDLEPAELEAGMSIEASTFVSNVGDEDILSSNIVRYYLSTDCIISGDDIAIGFVTIESVLSGDGVVEGPTLEIPEATFPGSYFIIAKVDDTGLIYELDETNNTDCETITISAPNLPDLVCNSLVSEDSVAVGSVMEVTLNISNIGLLDVAAPLVQVGFYLNSVAYDCELDAGALPFQSFEFSPPAAGISNIYSFDVTIPEGFIIGAYDILSYIDYSWEIDEETKLNNICCSPIILIEETNLADIEAIINFVTPTTIYAGEDITINYTFNNIGEITACCNFLNRFKLSTDCLLLDDVLLGNNTIDSLQVGDSYTNSITFTIPDTVSAGLYYMLMSANATDILPEITLVNNKPCWGTISIIDSTECTVDLSLTGATFDYIGGSGSFALETGIDCNWNIETVPAWVNILTPYFGTGNSTIVYSVNENEICEDRVSDIVISGQHFTITQNSIEEIYTISATEANFDWPGGESSLYVTATSDFCEWSANSPSDWVNLIPGPYTGSTTFYFDVDTNYAGPRSTTITIAGNSFNITQDIYVDVSNSDLSEILIYPNPTNSQLVIELQNKSSINEIIITDVLGKPIIVLPKTKIVSDKLIFDLSNFSAGIYFVNINTDKTIYSEKVIVEH